MLLLLLLQFIPFILYLAQMSKGIEYLRQRYQEIRNYAYNNEIKKLNYKDLGRYKDQARKQLQRMEQSAQFDNLQQVDFYREKFTQLQSAMLNASKTKMSLKDFTVQSKQILKQKGFVSRNSYLSQPPVDPRTTSQPPAAQSEVLRSFFQQKMSKVVPQVGFRSLLQNPPVSPKTFKKRIGANNSEIERLRAENMQLRRQLQINRGGGIGGETIQLQIRRQEERIRFLESENERLMTDNTKLKSERGGTAISYIPQNYDDYLYSPYILHPRQNDLVKISMRGSDIDTLSMYSQNVNNNPVYYQNNEVMENPPSFNTKSVNYVQNSNKNFQTMSDMPEIDRNKDRYSIFDMSRSHYSDYADLNNLGGSSGSSGIEDSRTAIRNKVAFFKNTGVIVKDQDIEIAYKRSQSSNLSGNRIIIYFNNKTPQMKKITVFYEFQASYYDLNVTQSVGNLQGLKQGRQVVEVRLKNSIQDLNSIIEFNVDVDGKRYKLWLPAMFIRFRQPKEGMMQSYDKTSKTVYPSKLFGNQIQTQKLIQNLEISGRGQALVWGQSVIHQGPIKMLWKSGNRLEVSTSAKWIDVLTFLMFDYR